MEMNIWDTQPDETPQKTTLGIEEMPKKKTAEQNLVTAGKTIHFIGAIVAIGGFIASCFASKYDPYFIFGLIGGLLVYLPCRAISAYFKVVANTSNTLKVIRYKLNNK